MQIVFSDFDGTLTDKGLLSASFFDVLELCKLHSKKFIIVSGRSISWGHFFLTHTTIPAVIMEGGGVILFRNEKLEIEEEYLVPTENINKLERISQQLVSKFGVKLSADSLGRMTDRAIELTDLKDSQGVEDFLISQNVNYSKSNVHLNFWVGDISKAKAIMYYLENYEHNLSLSEIMFFGDARNDESVFEHIPNTVGVSNIAEILGELKYPPKTVLKGEDNREVHGVLSYLKNLFNH